jgi:hypothetical protein
MAGEYLLAADFRPDTPAAACIGLTLNADEVSSPDLTIVIAAVSQRIDNVTYDHFSQLPASVREYDVSGDSKRLYLDQRCTSVTAVKTRDHTGTLTTQAATAYRLRSSLDSTGAIELHDTDYIEILPLGTLLSGPDIYWGYTWPCGTQTVQVTGNFGWTVTPGDIKHVVALLVWDALKREGGDIRRAVRWARGDLTVERATDTLTGLPEADDLLKPFIRGGDTEEPLVLIS